MDKMIKQVSLLADIMKGIQDDRARSEADERGLKEEGIREPEEREPSNTENESEMLPEKQKEVRTAKTEPAEEESQAEEEPLATPLEGETPQEIPEEVRDEPHEKKEEVIKRCVGLGATLFYLQARTVHVLDEKVERLEAGGEGENARAERPPPLIYKPDGRYKKEGSKLKNERPK